jgi:hypothetical protein
MSPFEFVIVLVSIILGLGITTLLAGIADIIKHIHQTKLFAPYIIWILLVFILHIHEWWISYQLKSVTTWPLPLFLFIILYPISLYILAHLLFPVRSNDTFDTRAYYFDHYSKFFICGIVLVLLSVVHNLFITQLPWTSQVIHLFILALLVTFVVRQPAGVLPHLLMAVFFMAVLLISLFLTQDTLLIE